MLLTSEMPSTRSPTCRAAMTSSHTDMATVSAPHARNIRISAGRLEGRAEQAQVDALLHGDGQRLGGLSGQLAQRRIVSVQHAEEARGHGVGLGAP